MNKDTHKVIRLGNCSTGDSEGGMCYSIQGISQTITAGTHGYGMGNIIIYVYGNECKETC